MNSLFKSINIGRVDCILIVGCAITRKPVCLCMTMVMLIYRSYKRHTTAVYDLPTAQHSISSIGVGDVATI